MVLAAVLAPVSTSSGSALRTGPGNTLNIKSYNLLFGRLSFLVWSPQPVLTGYSRLPIQMLGYLIATGSGPRRTT